MGNLLKGLPYSEVTATLEALDHAGLERRHLARLRVEPDFAKRVVEFMLRGGLESSTDIKLVRALMGHERVWGTEEWSSIYGVEFTKKQLREVAEFPWGKDILNAPCPFVEGKSIRETHFAFLGLDLIQGKPLTILKLHELHPVTGQPRFLLAAWYGNEEFAAEVTSELRWHLMPLETVPNSTEKTYQEQITMLPTDDYEMPLAVTEVLKDILYYKKNGEYLNPSRLGRCQDVSSNGSRVVVGRFNSDGLFVTNFWDDNRHNNIGAYKNVGIATSRKLPSA